MRFGWLIAVVLLLNACANREDVKPGSNPVESARSRVAIAAQYLQQGEMDKALRHLQRALEQDPKSWEAHSVMGVLMEQEGDDKRAEEHYRKSISLNAEYPQARNNYGVMLYRLKRYEESIRQLSLAAGNLGYDRRESAYENLGKAYLAVSDTTQARQAFEKALRLEPRLPDASLELAYMAFEEKDMPRANQNYQRHLKALGGDTPSPRSLWLGTILARERGDREAAAATAAMLKKLYPDSREYQAYLKSLGQDVH
ncbi:MAG TPA: type IV pilus biogenesis/stability protein PilW [Fluviicoccus sp.]|nr:type IV pilus biogenesis/stability protein PilW [Fluviicoccus sp.]